MSERAQALLREALTLAYEERADVAAELLASLDDAEIEDPAAVQAAWAQEIGKRARRVLHPARRGKRFATASLDGSRRGDGSVSH